jgi:hypothetical protein
LGDEGEDQVTELASLTDHNPADTIASVENQDGYHGGDTTEDVNPANTTPSPNTALVEDPERHHGLGTDALPAVADSLPADDATLPPPVIPSIPDDDLPCPDWDRITEADLYAMTRLDPLYEQVIAREILPRSQSTRLDFVTAAVRAREEGDNPPALFRTLVTNGLWAHATGEQEDTAHAMLKKHDWGPLPPLHLRLAPKAVPPLALSADAKTVETVRKWLCTEPYRGDPFHAFKRFAEARDWDRARWTAACDELDAKGIQDRGR